MLSLPLPVSPSTRNRWSSRALAAAGLAVLWGCASAGALQAAEPLRADNGAYGIELLVDGVPIRTAQQAGQTYGLGQRGDRYTIRVHNRTGRRVEAVVSVDGLDVMDGKPADYARKRGYLIDAYDSVDIDGWRLSLNRVAAFRFAAVPESYAARTGQARNVGVVGVALFSERERRPVVAPWRAAAPRAPEPQFEGSASDAAPAPSAKAAPGALAERRARSEGANESASAGAAPPQRPGLGTEFGEAHESSVRHVTFERASSGTPTALLGLRYDDGAGLAARGITWADDRRAELWLRDTAEAFPAAPRHAFARPPAGWNGN